MNDCSPSLLRFVVKSKGNSKNSQKVCPLLSLRRSQAALLFLFTPPRTQKQRYFHAKASWWRLVGGPGEVLPGSCLSTRCRQYSMSPSALPPPPNTHSPCPQHGTAVRGKCANKPPYGDLRLKYSCLFLINQGLFEPCK